MKPLTPKEKKLVSDNIGIAFDAYARLLNHRSRTVDHDDILTACFLGLMDAAKFYDPRRGTKLSTLATKCIFRRMQGVYRDRERHEKPTCSIDRCFCLHDTRAEPAVDVAIRRETSEIVQKAISELPDREADAVRCIELEGDTLKECGRRIGLSYEMARQLKNRGMEKLMDKLVRMAP